MRVGKESTVLRQTINIRRMHFTGVATETADPVVHVIDGNKNYVGGIFHNRYQLESLVTPSPIHPGIGCQRKCVKAFLRQFGFD